MKWNCFIIGMTVCAVTLFGSCQTNNQDQEYYRSGSITTEADGFSPMAVDHKNTIDFALTLKAPETVTSWKVEIISRTKVYKTFKGSASDAPQILSWTGKDEEERFAPDGIYYALLTIYDNKNTKHSITSSSFVLVNTAPTGQLLIVPEEAVMMENGFRVPVLITIEAVSTLASIESWSMEIKDPNGKVVNSNSNTWQTNSFSWNGLTYGKKVPDNATYTVVVTVRDNYGNMTNIGALIHVKSPFEIVQDTRKAIDSATEEGVRITPRSNGFSPNDDKTMDTIVFDLHFGKPLSVNYWKISILQGKQIVRQFISTAGLPPSEITWDGKKTDGSIADQDTYTASLFVDYGTEYKPVTVTTNPIILAIEAPTGTVTLSDPLFSPMESSKTIGISFEATTALARMESWSMRIYDPQGNLFKGFDGEWPNTKIVWDGIGRNGYLVDSAENYIVHIIVRDEFGNNTILKSIIPVDILVEKTATGYRILSSRIFFLAYTADYSSVESSYAQQNIQRLDQLAVKLQKFPGYKIKIVGHAVMIYWKDPVAGKIEQEEVLIPLSLSRADAVAKALVDRHLDETMIVTEGVGSKDPLVSDSDLINRWRNRRVSLYLEK